MAVDDKRNAAVVNALSSLKAERRFPNNVFIGNWADYLFFDPDARLFSPGFMEVKDLLLNEERSGIIALINMDDFTTDPANENAKFFLTNETAWTEYFIKLKGDGSAINWLFLRGRYVSASDKGSWCIYCEKENDIAALALRASFPERAASKVKALLKAKSIRCASSPKIDQSFDFNDLAQHWKSILINEYTQQIEK